MIILQYKQNSTLQKNVYDTILLLSTLLCGMHILLQTSFIIHASDKIHCKLITPLKGNQTYYSIIQVFKLNLLVVFKSTLAAYI